MPDRACLSSCVSCPLGALAWSVSTLSSSAPLLPLSCPEEAWELIQTLLDWLRGLAALPGGGVRRETSLAHPPPTPGLCPAVWGGPPPSLLVVAPAHHRRPRGAPGSGGGQVLELNASDTCVPWQHGHVSDLSLSQAVLSLFRPKQQQSQSRARRSPRS